MNKKWKDFYIVSTKASRTHKYGYQKSEVKTAPIVGRVKETILGMVKRF